MEPGNTEWRTLHLLTKLEPMINWYQFMCILYEQISQLLCKSLIFITDSDSPIAIEVPVPYLYLELTIKNIIPIVFRLLFLFCVCIYLELKLFSLDTGRFYHFNKEVIFVKRMSHLCHKWLMTQGHNATTLI